jgi:putative hydrolase of the HAD superfamily
MPGRSLAAAAVSRYIARGQQPSVPGPVKVRKPRRGLIIDLDDTLYPRERFVRSGLAAVARHVSDRFGVAAEDAFAVLTRASARGHAGNEMQVLCERFGLSNVVGTLVDVFRSHTPTIFLPAEAEQTLRALRAQGWALAILTNGLPSVQFRKVAALGLTALVDEVIYAEEHAAGGKPALAPFGAVLRALDLDPSECVCVGDDPARDVRGARALGIATIRVARAAMPVPVRLKPDSTNAGVDSTDANVDSTDANVVSGFSRTLTPADEADAVIDSLRQLPEAAPLLLQRVTADVA